jgi:hypothetical protein
MSDASSTTTAANAPFASPQASSTSSAGDITNINSTLQTIVANLSKLIAAVKKVTLEVT